MEEPQIVKLLDSGECLAYRGPVSGAGTSEFITLRKCVPDPEDKYSATALSEMPSYVAHQTSIRSRPFEFCSGELPASADLEVLINASASSQREYLKDLEEIRSELLRRGIEIEQLRRYAEVAWWKRQTW